MPAGFEICRKFSSELDAAEQEQLDALIRTAFPDDDEEWWDECDEEAPTLHFFGKMNKRIVSIVSLMEREISINGQMIIVGGIGGVATLPEWRKQGIAGDLMKLATSAILNEPRFKFGMLFCDAKLNGYYSRFGYEVIPNRIMLTYKGIRKPSDETTMVLKKTDEEFPVGVVELQDASW